MRITRPRRPTAVLFALALPLLAGCAADGATAGDATETDADYAERMAAAHADDAPTPGFAAEGEEGDGGEVTTSRVAYATVGGRTVEGYLARPADAAGAPGLIVIHEWWGLNDNVETMARMFAREGYQALAVDLYGGESADTPQGARALMSAVDEAAAKENLRQAHAYLTGDLGAGRVGVVGWCFGGAWSLETALTLGGEIDAAVIYYGRLVTDRERLSALEAPVLGLFGGEDQGIPVASVRDFEAALEALGKPATIHVFDGAGHAFANPSGQNYQPEAAKDAWEKTLAFLAEHLAG